MPHAYAIPYFQAEYARLETKLNNTPTGDTWRAISIHCVLVACQIDMLKKQAVEEGGNCYESEETNG